VLLSSIAMRSFQCSPLPNKPLKSKLLETLQRGVFLDEGVAYDVALDLVGAFVVKGLDI